MRQIHSRRRIPRTVAFAWAVVQLVLASCGGGSAFAGTSAAIDDLLAGGELANTGNPAASTYFLQDGRGLLTAEQEAQAIEQLRLSLRRQTGFMGRAMESAMGAIGGGPTSQKVMERVGEAQKPSSMLKSAIGGYLGVPISTPPSITRRESQQLQEDLRAGMAGPWIRGIEAARALEALGEAQAAARFYMNCIQMDPASWFSEACLRGIVQMGPRRAMTLLSWIVDNAEQVSVSAMTQTDDGVPDITTIKLRGAALRGLGQLIGEGALESAERDRALSTLLDYAKIERDAVHLADAAAGLGASRDPQAIEPLRRIAKARKQAAANDEATYALALGFHDENALRKLRKQLDDDDPERSTRALQLLLAADDAAAFAWAADAVTARRASENTRPDSRPRVVRELVGRGGDQARRTLDAILARGAGNDWLEAWTRLGLLELGDESQLPAVLAALDNADWKLDRDGIRTLWGRISPLVGVGLTIAMTGGISTMDAAQVAGRMIAAERARLQQKGNDAELVTLQLRWQAADALAASRDPAAVARLVILLDDAEPAVSMSAARALTISASPAALDAMVKAFSTQFGELDSESRTPDMRTALLRATLARYPDDERTKALCQLAALDPDAGVRFVALLALKKS